MRESDFAQEEGIEKGEEYGPRTNHTVLSPICTTDINQCCENRCRKGIWNFGSLESVLDISLESDLQEQSSGTLALTGYNPRVGPTGAELGYLGVDGYAKEARFELKSGQISDAGRETRNSGVFRQ